MTSPFFCRMIQALACLGLCVSATAAAQEPVGKVVERVGQGHGEAADAQKQVEALDDDKLDLVTQYRNVERRTASLDVYNEQLEKLIAGQQSQLDGLHGQIESVSVVGREVVPLMLRMIKALEQFVKLDIPFHMEERTQRVASLREMMDRADVSMADKYRRVLEAYQIENEFGRTIDSYRGKVQAGGNELAVEFLRVGRVSLVYRTLNGSEYGVWDVNSGSWQTLDKRYEREIVAALRIAKEQAAPNLIRVPVPAPAAVQ